MPRSTGTAVENNFIKGLITEATGLNFPENACVATENCVFNLFGQVYRRKGIDLESQAQGIGYADSTGLVVEFLWRAVALTGTFVFLVVQLGETVSFFDMSVTGDLSSGHRTFAVDLTAFRAPGGGSIKDKPCQFSAGSGRLFITHQSCDPIVVDYDDVTDSFSASSILVQIRDVEGVKDNLGVDDQPTTLTTTHWYNLKNQGWFQDVRVGTVTPGASGGMAGPIKAL
jgi:hypothetical protein